jgi:hypothetical protein
LEPLLCFELPDIAGLALAAVAKTAVAAPLLTPFLVPEFDNNSLPLCAGGLSNCFRETSKPEA